MKITYFGKKMFFPIREGLDRLTWDLARAMQKKGFKIEIRCISNKKDIKYIDGIKIIEDNIFALSRLNTDILHLLVHPNPQIILPLFFGRMKKVVMTIADGEMGGFWNSWWSPFIVWLIKKKISSVIVQTRYQRDRLSQQNIRSKIILPYLEKIKRKCRRNSAPTLLYMGLPYEQKGFTDAIAAFYLAKKVIPNLKLVIADSRIRKNTAQVYRHLRNDKDIKIKSIIDRESVLSRAWICMYPLRSPQNTMAIPLSLIESAETGTAFISTRVGGIPEIAPDCLLVPPADSNALAQKVIELVKKYPKKIILKIKLNNERSISQMLAEYELTAMAGE